MFSPSNNGKSDLDGFENISKENEPILKADTKDSQSNRNNQIWLKKTYKKYYFNFFANITLPKKIHLHEFGFRHFDDDKMHRHLSFKNSGELYAFVLKSAPSDIFCSSSFYNRPTEPMDKKEWSGSELIFDIDGKDLHLECAIAHNFTQCYACKHINKGVLEKCTNCNSSKLHTIDIPCKNCVISLKKEVAKLLSFLTDDFGIERSRIFVYFSGNNGFHLHIVDDDYYPLLSNERSEIASYILGKGFKMETLGMKKNSENKIVPMLKNRQLLEGGWRDRVLKKLKINFYSGKSSDSAFISQIEKLENAMKCDFQQIVSKTVNDLSVKIDPMVTMDIHRIFRLAGSLNSKSGLAKILCNDLDSFDPFSEACFYDKSKVEISCFTPVSLVFKGKKHAVNEGKNHVPEYVAVYLISKGLANINSKDIQKDDNRR
jgi:DNA primase small subunit